MTRKILPLVLLGLFFLPTPQKETPSEKDLYRIALKAHRFSQRPHLMPEEVKQMPKRDRPDLAWEQNFLETMDPAIGRPAPERLLPIYEQVAQRRNALMATPGASSSPWVERGPTNVAGRTRALTYDPNDPAGTKVWAGGVTGGLWYNNDITNANSQWVAVNDFWDNIAITAIAFDPTNTNTIYVGTGEGWGSTNSGSRGAGIWKSTDGGSSWSHLSATSNFYFVNDLAVRNENGTGVLYVALRGNYYGGAWHGSADQGVQRSANGGTSFSQVLPTVPGQSFNYAAADIEIATDNTIWVGTTNVSWAGSDRGGGRVLSSSNGFTWSTEYTSPGGERVEVACAPSDGNYVYAMIEANSGVDAIVRTFNGGGTWLACNEPNDADNGIPSTDFSRGQAWYDLILAVDPNNRNTVIAGAIDLFRTTNGGTSWSQISKWSNNNNLAQLSCSEVHADQHAIIFKPGSSSEVLFGNDGGVFYTNSVSSAANSNVIHPRNNGYNVTQFYACAIHPTAATDYFLAGSQDNGSQQFNSFGLNSTTEVTGGDGAYCFIDQTDPNYQITSYVYNNYWLSTNGGATFGPGRIQNDGNTGKFINPADYDDEQDVLYSARTASTINRISNISSSPSIGYFTVSGMSSTASHIRVSPHTTSSTTLFVGTEAGDLYKVSNAQSFSPISVSIGGSLPAGNISCVEVGSSENELIVTYSNYGMTSVWYTANGGASWSSKEGDLPDMPVRWALFNPNDNNEVILATEVGVWSTSNFNNPSPSWTASSSGLANVRVDMLQMRDSDDEVVAATHGRGLFTSSGFAASVAPTANLGYSNSRPCTGETVTLIDSSAGTPTSWQWSITPNTFSYATGNSASSQNPQVVFNAAGSYNISLVVTNANGTDSIGVTQALVVGGVQLPFMETFEGSAEGWTVSNPDQADTWSLFNVAGNTPGSFAAGIDNYNYDAVGERDGLISPPLDLSGYSQASLDFEYAYRRYSTNYQDSMAVYISTDCGVTWNRIASYEENGSGNFVTGSNLTSSFLPSSSADWCGSFSNPSCPSIDISAYAGNSNVKIKFENINGYGNNLFIDNVNVTGTQPTGPSAEFAASATAVCLDDTVSFTDASTGSPTSWSWSFVPNTITYVNGSSASSQHPEVRFDAIGSYEVSLTSTSALGSDSITKSTYIDVGTAVTPSVSIAASDSSICSGSTVSFSATPVNGGTNPSYQWKVNGVNAGSNSSLFNTATLSQNDVVSVVMTSDETCVTNATATSPGITMNVTNSVAPSVSVTASSTSICSGNTVNFTAVPTNGGSNPSYQWKVNGMNVGTDSPTYSTSALGNNDVVKVYMTSSESCVTNSTVSSTSMLISVTNAVTPTVSISASDTSICAGASVTFTASPTHGGGNPSYQWKINGVNVGSNSSTYSTTTLSHNDLVTVQLSSSENCVTASTVSSPGVSMSVSSPATPTVSVFTTDTLICEGQSASFSASVSNGGSNPTYQWKVNGNNVGAGIGFASLSNLQDGDSVWVEVTSNASCLATANAISAPVVMEVVPLPTVTINTSMPVAPLCKEDTLELSASYNSFGRMGQGMWSGPGVSGEKFIASDAGDGIHTLYYQFAYLNDPFCSGYDTLQVAVEEVPTPTISDNGYVLTCDQSGYNYQWIKDGTAIAGATAQSYTVTGSGMYSVQIGLTSCEDQSLPFNAMDFDMAEVKAAIGFKLYPNPASEEFRFEMRNPGNSTAVYELIAFNGAVVRRKEIPAEAVMAETVDISGLADGIYSLRVRMGKQEFTERLVKK